MLDRTKAKLRKLENKDLSTIIEWRNHQDIRKWMVNTSIISYDDHLQWFIRNQNRTDRHFFVFEYMEQLEGYISFQKIENSKAYEWGFYIKPNTQKGMGLLLGEVSLVFAFRQLNIGKIFGQVLSFNQKSIKFHQNLGFFQEGVLRKHFNDERGEFDIFQFGLLQSEWLERQV